MTNERSTGSGLLRVAREAPEALVLLVGIGLRFRLHRTFDVQWGYDWQEHFTHIRFIAEWHALPGLTNVVTAYHPPLYYWLCALAVRHGATAPQLQWVSIGAGIARLVLIAIGLRLYVGNRLARLVALSIAALLPTSLQLDAMLTNESLHALFATAALLAIPPLFRADGARRWGFAALFGALLALALACKVSSVMIALAVALGAVLELVGDRGRDPGTRLRRLAPIAIALVFAGSVSAPLYLRHHGETGKWLPSGFDSPRVPQRFHPEAVRATPYWKRRPPGYLFGLGSGDVLLRPYWPSAARPVARFWPMVIATTFVDYWNYHFDGAARPGESTIVVLDRPLRTSTVGCMRAAVAAGALLALITVAALVHCVRALVRSRDAGRLAVVAAPVLAVIGLIHFSYAFPFDEMGTMKGHYLQFVAPPLEALCGLGVARLWRRRSTRPVAILAMGAVAAIAAYTLHAQRVWWF